MKSEKSSNEEINYGLRLLVKSSIIIFVAIVLSKIFSYLYRIITARYFGPEIYGLFSLSIAIVGVFVAISSLGFSEGIVRYLSFYRGRNEKNKIRFIFQFSSKILVVSVTIFSLILFSLSKFISISLFHNPDLIPFLKIFSIMIPFWVFSIYLISVMRSFEKIKGVAFIDKILQNSSKLIFLVIFIFIGLGTNAIIFSFFMGIFLMFLASFFYSKIKIPEIFKKYNLSKKSKKIISRKFFSYSGPMLLLGLISTIFYWIDSITIGFFKSTVEVGLYNAVIPIALLLNLAPEIFLQLLFPLIIKKYSLRHFKFISEISKQIGKWIFMINLPVFLLMIFFPGVIIGLLFGSEYLVAINSLRFLIIGSLVSSIFIISNNLIAMIGKSKIIFYDVAIASILNIILNILLVPQQTIFGIDNSLGINGAAIATTISVLFFNFLIVIQAKHYTSIIPLKIKVIRVFLAAIIPFIVIVLLRKIIEVSIFSAIFLTIIFLMIYIILLFLFKGFDKNDLMIFNIIKRKIVFNKKGTNTI